MSVNSDEEETIEKELMDYWKPKRMSDKELMEYWKAVQAKTGKTIHLDAFSKEPLDPNRRPRLPAKLGTTTTRTLEYSFQFNGIGSTAPHSPTNPNPPSQSRGRN